MMPLPPVRFARLLARAVRNDPAGPAILGDLHEDFVARVRRCGLAGARRWYRREVTLLVLGRMLHAALSSFTGNGFMSTFLRPVGFRHDFANAVRTMRRSPGAYVLLALVIGLGVGATTAVYSVVKPMLLAPLPFEDPGELVWIQNTEPGESLSSVTSRSGNLRDFRALNRTFDGMTGYNAFFDQSVYTLGGEGASEQTRGVGVAHDFLEVLGVEPVHGRSFTAEEGVAGGPPVIVLTHGFWQRRYAGDRSIVGTSVLLEGEPHEVIGVLPETFDFGSLFKPGTRVDFLYAFPVGEPSDRWGNTMFFIGRLRPGVTAAAAEADLHSIMARLEEEQPDRWGLGASVTPLQAQIAGPFRPALLLLAAAAAAVMLIVCFNVANVLLARSPRRSREVAVRKALGATRGRIVRQFLLESLLLACGGAAAGIALAIGITAFVSGLSGMAIPLLDRVAVDGSALAFAILAATVAGLLAGLVPALQVAEGAESETLRAASRGASSHRAGRRLREMLVVAELAVACALLVAGGLLVRSFQEVLAVDLGFETDNAVAWQLNPSRDFDSFDEMTTYYTTVASRIASLSGVESVGMTDALPLGKNRTWGYRVVGEVVDPDEAEGRPGIFPHLVGPDYLETMRIPLVDGRSFTAFDNDDAPPVVMINQTAAEAWFPGESAVGRQVFAGGADEPWEIVGVVADVRHLTPESGPGFEMYFPMFQMWDFSSIELVVRSPLPPAQLAASVTAALAELDPGMPTADYWTLEASLDRVLSARRFTLQVLGGFGVVALLLAALGIYGVLSQSVAERTREIGIRMTLGASANSVRRSVVGRTLLLSGVGIGLGLLAALAGSRLLSSLLFGVPAADPATLATMAGLLLAVSALSGLIPALRASRTDALGVLRGEG